MSRNKQLTLLQRISLELLWLMCRAIGIMPHWVKYHLISSCLYFLLYRCVRYRVKVVRQNLERSFPDLSEGERDDICRKFYHILAEIMVSTLSLANRNSCRRVINEQTADPEQMQQLRSQSKGGNWIAMTAHFGLWEYFMFWGAYADQNVIAVYHPLESIVFEELFKRLRHQTNVVTVALRDTVRYAIEHRDGVDGKNFVLGLIADQNPPLRPNSHWMTFLNQDTVFFDGGEKIALKLKLPVRFVYLKRIKPGRYTLAFKPIYDGVEEVEPNEITQRYVTELESVIRETPELWLWSHKRWKYRKPKCKTQQS